MTYKGKSMFLCYNSYSFIETSMLRSPRNPDKTQKSMLLVSYFSLEVYTNKSMFLSMKKKRLNQEQISQIKLIDWAWHPDTLLTYPHLEWLVAVPNGMFTTKNGAYLANLEGRKSGVFDLQLLVPSAPWFGLLIEMKKPKGGVMSDTQKNYGNAHSSLGYCCRRCNTFEEAQQLIIDYLCGKPLGDNPVF